MEIEKKNGKSFVFLRNGIELEKVLWIGTVVWQWLSMGCVFLNVAVAVGMLGVVVVCTAPRLNACFSLLKYFDKKLTTNFL